MAAAILMLQPHLYPHEKQVFQVSLAKENAGLRAHFGNGRNQIRRGTAKQEKADCRGATGRVKPEQIMLGGRTLVQRSCGNNLRIPAKTKNIPVSNSTEIKWDSMSPVATGKLSRLSSCMNGENTAISTIRTSTIFGILRGIVLAARRSWKRAGHRRVLRLR